MGAVIFGVFALYLIISFAVVLIVARTAKKKGKSTWCWGGGAALVMYLLVFWDQIPTILVHKYYCEKEAGFWVYKTIDQWKAENPVVAETLTERNKPKTTGTDGHFRYWTTQRFYTDRKQMQFLHGILKEEEILVDASTSQPLARSINFWRGKSGNVFAMGGTLDDYRQALVLGFGNRGCGAMHPTEQLRVLRYQFQKMGEGK